METEPEEVHLWRTSGKLLGFIVSNHGIEANPNKIAAITDMKASANVRYIQKLTGCMASNNKFISRLGERGLPFFNLLKRTDKFQWTEEANKALEELKELLSKSLVLTAPLVG